MQNGNDKGCLNIFLQARALVVKPVSFAQVFIAIFLISNLALGANKKLCTHVLGSSEIGKKSRLSSEQIRNVVDAVRATFPVVKTNPRVMKPEWLAMNEKLGLDSVGVCAAATNAIYHLLGGKAVGLTPMVASYFDPELKVEVPSTLGRASHWWLRDADDNWIDATEDQYTKFNKSPPYHLGKGAGFQRPLTTPTIAGRIIMDIAIEILRQRGLQSNGLPISP